MIHDETMLFAKTKPEAVIKLINDWIEQFKNNDNYFIKSRLQEIVLLFYENLDDPYQKQVEKQVNDLYTEFQKMTKEFQNSKDKDSDQLMEQYNKFLSDNQSKLAYLNAVNSGKIKENQEWVLERTKKIFTYTEIHSKNLKIIEGLLDSCKKSLYHLKNDINKLSRKNISPDEAYRWEFKEIIAIAAWLRHCIEIVVWWAIKYGDKTTVENFKNKIKNNKYRTGKLFEIYRNDPELNIEIWSWSPSENDLISMKSLHVKIWEHWEKSKIKLIYDKLSSLIHYDFQQNVDDETNSYLNKTNAILKGELEGVMGLFLDKEKYMKDGYNYLNNVYEFIYESLKNHVIKMNDDEFIIFVENFKIDTKKSVSNVKLEKATNNN